jgi:ABC-type nitrate/sulfonate/bicarbonate transport system substrate-binding protein
VTGPPSHLVAQEAGMRVLADVADLGIAWPSGGTVARRALIAARPAVVAAYVKAYTEAVHLLRTDRERSVDTIVKYGELADRTLAEQTWAIYRDRYALPPYPDVKALETVVAEELVNTSPRAHDVPLDAFYDDRFVRELDQSGFVQALARP